MVLLSPSRSIQQGGGQIQLRVDAVLQGGGLVLVLRLQMKEPQLQEGTRGSEQGGPNTFSQEKLGVRGQE